MINVRLDTKRLEKALIMAPGAIKAKLEDGFDHLSRKFLKEWRNKRLKGPPGIMARPRGIFTHFHRKKMFSPGHIMDMGVSISSDSNIAGLHETGGIIQAPSGGKMAVPLKASPEARNLMYTATGKLRKKFKDVKNLRNIVPIKFNNKVFLVRVKKKTRDILPLYVLKREVKLKPRLEFYKTWESMQPIFIRILNTSVSKALKKTGWA